MGRNGSVFWLAQVRGGGGGGGGVHRISSDGDDQRIFGGLKFSIPGFFWVGKFGKYFFGYLDLSRDFEGIQNNRKICGSALVSQPHSSVNEVQPNLFCSCFNPLCLSPALSSLKSPFVVDRSFNPFWKFLRLRNSA